MTTCLTVIIPCKDERPNLEACLESIKPIADEIIVADSGSTDGTLEMARQRGDCRIIERDYRCWSDFVNWSIPQATHDWVLVVDADERATPELVREIQRLKQSELATTRFQAFSMPRQNYFLGQRIRYSGWQHDRIKRLFRKSCRFTPRRTHSTLDVPDSQIQPLKAAFTHFTFRTLKHFLAKQERYAAWNAEELRDKQRRPSVINMTLRPAFRFFRHYILQLGFLDGMAGAVISGAAAYAVFAKYAFLWELHSRDTSLNSQTTSNDLTPQKTQSQTAPLSQRRAA